MRQGCGNDAVTIVPDLRLRAGTLAAGREASQEQVTDAKTHASQSSNAGLQNHRLRLENASAILDCDTLASDEHWVFDGDVKIEVGSFPQFSSTDCTVHSGSKLTISMHRP